MPASKIAFIHPYQLRLLRGIEVWLWHLAHALAQQGFEVHILTWDGPLAPPPDLQHPNLTLRQVPALRYFQHLVAVPFYIIDLLRGGYDHIFVNFAGYGEGPALSFYRLVKHTPFSLVLHFPPFLVPHRYREFTRWRFHKQAHHIIAVSQVVAQEAGSVFDRPCTVIGHGVDSERFKPDNSVKHQVRSRLGISDDACVLISAAAFEERKGIQWVIHAMPQILKKSPNTYYLIAGDGSYRRELEQLVAEQNLETHIQFLGHQSNVVPYYQAADMFLLLSTGEASPISIPEALSCGLPLITSTHPPFPDLVDPSCGFLVDERDPLAVARAVLRLWQDEERLEQMRHATRQWALDYHDWEVVAHQYIDLLMEACK